MTKNLGLIFINQLNFLKEANYLDPSPFGLQDDISQNDIGIAMFTFVFKANALTRLIKNFQEITLNNV